MSTLPGIARPDASDLPVLAGTRTRLRALAARDAEALPAVLGDPHVMRHWSHAPLRAPADIDWYLRDAEAGCRLGSHCRWAIVSLPGDALIGIASLHGFADAPRRAEISYVLAASHWGRGHAREAVRLLIGCAFTIFDLERLDATVDIGNLRSRRLLDRLGFVEEAVAGRSTRHALLRTDGTASPRA